MEGHKKSVWVLAAMATPGIAITAIWVLEGSAIVPLLKTFGMSNQDVSLVTVAGPLTGMFIAPAIGTWSDQTRSRFGRRVPYIVSGAFLSIMFQQLIAHALEIAQSVNGTTAFDSRTREIAKYITMMGFICMYISTNIMLMPHRALVAEIAGEERQSLAHSLVSIMDSGGGLIVTGFSSVLNPTVYIRAFMWMVSGVMLVAVVVCVALGGPHDAQATRALKHTQATPVEEDADDDPSACHESTSSNNSAARGLLKYLPKTLTEIRYLPKDAWPVVLGFLFWNVTSSTFATFWVAFAAETVLGGVADGADICEEQPDGCTSGQLIYLDGVVLANRAALIGSCLGLLMACFLPLLVSPQCKLGTRLVFVCMSLFTGASIVAALLYRSLTITSGSALYVVWRGVAGAAAAVIPFAVVGEVVARECPEKLGLFLGTLNIFNVCGQVIANLLTTFTSESAWGYGRPIFIGGVIGMGMPICGLFIKNNGGRSAVAINSNYSSEPLLGDTPALAAGGTGNSCINGSNVRENDTSCGRTAARSERQAAESLGAAMITTNHTSRQTGPGAASFFFLRQRRSAAARPETM